MSHLWVQWAIPYGEIPYVMWKAAGKRLIYIQWKAQTSVYILYLTASGTHSVATLANRVQNIFDPNLNISKVTLKLILLLHIYLTTNITNTDRRATIITWDCTPHNKWLEIHKYWMTSCTRFMCVMMCLHIFFVCNVHNVLLITWILYVLNVENSNYICFIMAFMNCLQAFDQFTCLSREDFSFTDFHMKWHLLSKKLD